MFAHVLPLLLCATLVAQVHVSPTGNDAGTGTPADPFRTVNHAAAVAVSGGTIFLQAGVYGDEQGVIVLGNKDLVLQGAGSGATAIRPHLSLTVTLPQLAPGAAPAAHRVGVLIDGPARVHLRDLTLDAQQSAPPSGQLVGIYVRGGADVVCEQCTVRGFRGAAFGIGLGHAVAVHGDVAVDPTTLLARRSQFTDFADGGVFARLRAEVDLQECTVVGAGPASTVAQVGVRVVDDAIAQVRLCRITACSGATGAAVRMRQQSTGCTVSGNRITRCAIGVDVGHSPPSIVPGELRNNRIAAAQTTIRIEGVSGLFVTGNSLSTVSRWDPTPYFDNTAAGNAWASNHYPVSANAALAGVAIPGGGNFDATAFAGVPEFGERQRIACGGAPISVVAADFDGDGRDDFATLDLVGHGAGLTIGLWRPTGYLIQTVAFAPRTVRPVALRVGEFDGTVGHDLVALTAAAPPSLAGAAFWVFGNDGAGAFTQLHQQGLPGFVDPADLVAMRLNGDGRDDLVIIDRGSQLLQAGAGTSFVNAFGGVSWTATALPGAFAGGLQAVAAGDLDGDGVQDLAAVEAGTSSALLHVWRGDGLGSLTTSLGGPWNTPEQPRGVTIADFDGDLDRDVLVVATAGSLPLQPGALQIFANEFGVLAAQSPLATDYGPVRVLAADFDTNTSPANTFPANAGPDLLVCNPAAGDLTLFGSHQLTNGFNDGGLVTMADTPVDVAIGDFNLDSYRDLVIAEPGRGGVAVLRGIPSARVRTLGTGCPGTAGRVPRLTVGGSPGLPLQPNATLQLELHDGFPSSVAACAIALDTAPVLVPCGYLLTAPLILLGTPLDTNGSGAFALPLPALPDARGFRFCAQAGVFDFAATTSFLPDISLTAAVCLRVGN